MAEITTVFEFNILEGSASIKYYVGEELRTTWTFQDGEEGVVTCPAKEEPGETNFTELKSAFSDTDEWIKFIRNHGSYYKCFNAAKEDYVVELKRDEDKVEDSFKVGGDEFRGLTWNKDTDEVSVPARPAINFSWGTYLAWIRAGKEFLRMIEDFKKTEGE